MKNTVPRRAAHKSRFAPRCTSSSFLFLPVIFSALFLVFLAACSNPAGGGGMGLGITFGEGKTTYYTVTFDAAGGSPAPAAQTVAAGGKAAEPGGMTNGIGDISALAEGLYHNTVEGWYTSAAYTGDPWNFSAPVTGSLTLYAKWTKSAIDLSGRIESNTLAKALAWIREQTPAKTTGYTILLNGNYSLPGVSSANITTANAVITLLGKSASNITLSSNGSMFYSTAGTLVLDNNITLTGRSDNTAPLVYVSGASTALTMKTGSMITGNKNGRAIAYGGGVYISGGSFTMEGGTVSNNTARYNTGSGGGYGGGVYISGGSFTMSGSAAISNNTAGYSTGSGGGYGGGVYVFGGSFTMEGGTISNNTARHGTGSGFGHGGGVYISGGSFTMSGSAAISNNTAGYSTGSSSIAGSGGGVYVFGGSFTMEDGTISNNTADYGGGVYISGGGFSKSGGTIYGDTDGNPDNGNATDNTAKSGNTWGHAVFCQKDSISYCRDATLGEDDDISTADTLPAASGQTLGYWTRN